MIMTTHIRNTITMTVIIYFFIIILCYYMLSYLVTLYLHVFCMLCVLQPLLFSNVLSTVYLCVCVSSLVKLLCLLNYRSI